MTETAEPGDGTGSTQEPLPRAEFAFPGPLRDQLVAAVLDGSKTSTTGLLIDYERDGAPMPVVGQRAAVVDSDGRPVAVIETTGVRVVPLGDVDLAHAVDEGEGYTTVAQWRSAHEEFWHSAGMRDALGDPGFTVDDTTPLVLERFRLVPGPDAVAQEPLP
ncbi:ASCH domain-containing protein [Streptomyces sp. NPDC029674]|uniref:ASCH domain-containing protein n=1 Tax=Streptomyces sp. NPDC029674 TaxID=3365297 RepID=UPI00384A51E6